ncbi:hypothetical protein [Gardnerella vaginalis]|uniref:Uncharacterized protein n=1 Tax=Gardnerella vaginalis JCP8108 TaxID=1261066 RepID=S4GX62_GARVA|nr:hypothetical protein [Gardnerella vaginalis]EPI47170.1 hypothetical protein HMPREF1581_00904 [Gardnerella vaginalis JCP8108]
MSALDVKKRSSGEENKEDKLKEEAKRAVKPGEEVNEVAKAVELGEGAEREEEETSESNSNPSSKETLDKRNEKLKRYRDTSLMREWLGYVILAAVVLQIVVLDVCMSSYVFNNLKKPDAAIVIAWLTTNFTEIVGILIVVASSIFPFKNGKR